MVFENNQADAQSKSYLKVTGNVYLANGLGSVGDMFFTPMFDALTAKYIFHCCNYY